MSRSGRVVFFTLPHCLHFFTHVFRFFQFSQKLPSKLWDFIVFRDVPSQTWNSRLNQNYSLRDFFCAWAAASIKKNNDSGKCESFDCMTFFFPLKTDFLSITFLALFVSYIAVLKKFFIGSQGEERKGRAAQGRLGSKGQGRTSKEYVEEGQGSLFTQHHCVHYLTHVFGFFSFSFESAREQTSGWFKTIASVIFFVHERLILFFTKAYDSRKCQIWDLLYIAVLKKHFRVRQGG